MKARFYYRKTWISFAILIIGMVITIAGTIYSKNENEVKSKRELALICNEIKTRIISRLYTHAQLLRSGSSFFAACDTVTRNDWKIFYEKTKIAKNLPGTQGIGFSEIIKKEELKKHTQHIRNEGYASYTVYPKLDRDIYTSIIYIEPFTDRNQRAFGYDMYSEPVRRKAMDRARDCDVAALSGKVVLVQETDTDLQAGTLMYVPVYKNGMPTNTLSERRSAILGWVYSPYRMADLMHGILGAWNLNDKNKIHLQVYDDDSISQQSLLYDSQRKEKARHTDIPSHILTIPIVFNDKKWTLRFSQSNEQSSNFQQEALIILIGGTLIVLLLFWLSLSIINTSRRAQHIAEQLATKLTESESRFSSFMDYLPVIAFIKDNEGKTVFVNKFMDEALGASKWLGKNMVEIFPNEFGIKLLDDDLQVLKLGEINIEENIMLLDQKVHTFSTQKFIISRQGKESYIGGISLDITDRKLAEKELKESREQLRNFTAHLQQVREKERLAITIEIHDSLAQYLVALKMDMGMFKKKIANSNKTLEAIEVITALDEFIVQVENTNKSARMIMNGLRPEQLELLGFIEATEVHLHDYKNTHHLNYEFINELLEPNITPEQSLVLFRILQESLSNIHKHAMATFVKVLLTSSINKLILEIMDNGVGFDQNNCGRPDSYGLIGMKELIKTQNGSFTISTKPNEGTTIRVELPYRRKE